MANAVSPRYSIDYDAIPPALWAGPPRRRAEELLPGTGHRQFALGRSALLWLCRTMGWGPGDRFLLPAYLCDAIVAPFLAAGVIPEIYKVGPDLSVDLDDLTNRLGPSIRGGLVIHYFGWPQPPAILRWLEARSPGDGFWIEDLTHALFSTVPGRPLGTRADAAFASYRKLIPCPDGCGLAFRERAPGPMAVPAARGSRYRGHGLARAVVMGWAGLHGGADASSTAVSRVRRWREGPVGIGPWAPGSRRIVERFDITAAARARRENAARLAVGLESLPEVKPLFTRLDPGVVPMAFPIQLAERDRVLAAIRARGVDAVHHWSLPAGLTQGEVPVADRLRRELLSLPIDERYTPADMDTVAAILADCIRSLRRE